MRRRTTLWTAALLAALAGCAAAAVVARDAQYRDRPLPGVTVRAVDLDRPVVVSVAGGAHPVAPREVLELDAAATERAAAAAGRDSLATRIRALVDPSPPPQVIEPVLRPRTDAAAALVRLGKGLRPPAPARIERRGDGFVVVPSRAGDAVDADALVPLLRGAALAGEERVVAPLTHVDPARDTAAAAEAVARAERLASAPVTLRFRGDEIGVLPPERLARLVRFAPREDHFVVTLDRARLARAVAPALEPWRKRARNARFRLAGDRVRILPSAPGLDVDAARALDEVTAAAYSSLRVADLGLKETRADLTTKEAVALGIRERISTFTTDMGTSSANRIHNVHLMADYIDGTVVRPGETFSFNDSVGPRSVERGFREGQMIVGSLLLPSIGGGVCQTATTLFNNALELGLPIVERHNHSFYISHYPMGRDATVAWGGPDFVFRNDLKTGILIKARYTATTLTFSFYGTDPRRRVVTTTTGRSNWRQPRTTYALDPFAPRGSMRLVSGSNQPGFDVTVHRRVYEGSKLVRSDAFPSAYIAVGPTAIYGPGRSIPGPYFVLPRV